MKPRVLLEQRILPNYRVPFFNKLAKSVELKLLISIIDQKVLQEEGLNTEIILDCPIDYSKEVYNKQYTINFGKYHEKTISIIENYRPNILLASTEYITTILAYPKLRNQLKRFGIKTIAWGCSGYEIDNFHIHLKNRKRKNRIYEHPRGYFQQISHNRAMKRINGFLAYSQHTKNFWNTVFNITHDKISIAYNAIDTSQLLAYSGNSIANSKNRNSENTLVLVGRLVKSKSIDKLIRAFREVQTEYPEARLKIIGDGPYKIPLNNLSSQLQLNNVEFTGAIYEEANLAEKLSEAGIFVLPGLGGLGMNSAMACGLPVICGNADGTEEHLIIEGETGFRFDGSEEDLVRCIKKAMMNRHRFNTMGNNARNLITDKYNLENMVDVFLERIDIVLTGSN